MTAMCTICGRGPFGPGACRCPGSGLLAGTVAANCWPAARRRDGMVVCDGPWSYRWVPADA